MEVDGTKSRQDLPGVELGGPEPKLDSEVDETEIEEKMDVDETDVQRFLAPGTTP